jgi:hypothetical protein
MTGADPAFHRRPFSPSRICIPADICKQHLREKYRDQLGLVEEFIVEIEGPPKNFDVTRWGQFTDIKDIKKEMLNRLAAHFEKWLNP